MNDFAATHRRWGYKRAWARAKSEGIVVGRDTFRRLWRAEGLRVRPRKAPKPRTAPRLQRLVKASAPGQVWAIDFQFDSDWRGWPGLVLWTGCFEGCWLLLVVLCPLARVLVG